MKKAFKTINVVFLIMCFVLLSGLETLAQKDKSAEDKERRLTTAEIVSEFERLLKEAASDCGKQYLMNYLAPASLAIGDTEKAKIYAQKLLTKTEATKKCYSNGDAVHIGNLTLGRTALASGDIAEVKYRLLESGKTTGSPALNSFGPNMLLAEELLKKNETAVVIEYFDLCAKFWDFGSDKLKIWKKQIKTGQMPDFGTNLAYGLRLAVDVEMVEMIKKAIKEN